jgi:hypothetical protein
MTDSTQSVCQAAASRLRVFTIPKVVTFILAIVNSTTSLSLCLLLMLSGGGGGADH